MSNKSMQRTLDHFNTMTKPDLQEALLDCAKKLSDANKQIQQKDKLIADFTSQRERANREAEQVLTAAKEQAALIRKEADRREEEAEKRIAEVNADVARKIANANAEADSIVESRLNQARADIENVESRREEAKRSAIALNRNIVERYDSLISDVEEQISRFKDMQQSLNDFNVDIEAEDFKKFNMDDYVTPKAPAPSKKNKPAVPTSEMPSTSTRKHVTPSVKPVIDVDNDDVSLGDEDLEALSYIFDEDFVDEEPEEEEIEELDDTELLSDEDLAFLNSDLDLNVDMELSDDDDIFSDIGDSDSDDDDDLFANGKMKSFTDSFMAVRSSDDDDDDFDDLDIDSIFDDDDDEQEPPTPAPKIAVPTHRQHRSGRRGNGRGSNGNPGRWLS